jgi:hypothetical protein
MTNVLDGVQFRTLKVQFPSWRTEESYHPWQDCEQLTNFPSGTEFRVAPVTQYVVTDSFDKKVLTSKDKTEAMAKVSSMLAEDNFASIRRDETKLPHIAAYLSDQSIQFKLSGSDKWLNPPHFGGTAVGSAIRFRRRPDTYFQVDIKTGIAMSTLTFDDVDELPVHRHHDLPADRRRFHE